MINSRTLSKAVKCKLFLGGKSCHVYSKIIRENALPCKSQSSLMRRPQTNSFILCVILVGTFIQKRRWSSCVHSNPIFVVHFYQAFLTKPPLKRAKSFEYGSMELSFVSKCNKSDDAKFRACWYFQQGICQYQNNQGSFDDVSPFPPSSQLGKCGMLLLLPPFARKSK